MVLVDARPALAEAASVGPFFELAPFSGGVGWRPLGDLVEGDAAMAERVGAATALVARRTGVAEQSLEPRVVASTVFLGLAARLLAPSLGAVVLAGVLPRLTPGDLWWQPVESGPWPIVTRVVEGMTVTEAEAPQAYAAAVVDGLVAPVLSRVRDAFALSEQVLWGDVGSALGGAVTMLAAARPDVADRAQDLLTSLLAVGPLAGTADLIRSSAGPPTLVRRSCCLFYRVPGGGLCGDCVLTRAPRRRRCG